MISGDVPILAEWVLPIDPSTSRKVHRLIFEGFQFSNIIEWAAWHDDLAWLWACEGCGGPECSGRGVAKIRRIEDQLVWMRTMAEDFPENWEETFSIEKQGVIGRAAWEKIQLLGIPLPQFDFFHPLCREDLARLWLAEMPDRARVDNLTSLDVLLRGELAASHPLDHEVARRRIQELTTWFTESPDEVVKGCIRRIDPPEGLQTFFIDRTGYPEWAAFVASDRWTLAFEGGFLYEFP